MYYALWFIIGFIVGIVITWFFKAKAIAELKDIAATAQAKAAELEKRAKDIGINLIGKV
jgi:hypothetical protein